MELYVGNKFASRFCSFFLIFLFLSVVFGFFEGQTLAQAQKVEKKTAPAKTIEQKAGKEPEPAKKSDKPMRVGVAKAEMIQETNKIELPGNVLPWATSRLAAEVEGRVEKIMANEGQAVAAGMPLIYLRTQPLKLELEVAQAEREMTSNRLQEMVAGTRPEIIAAGQAALKNTEAALKLAQTELARIEKLFKEGVLSSNDFDNAKTAVDRAQANHDEKKAQLDELVAGVRAEEIRQQESRLLAADAQIKRIVDNIDRSIIFAPFDGVVIEKLTEVGQWLEKGDPGMTLIATNPIKVEVHVPQRHLYRVTEGIKVDIILELRQEDIPDSVFKGRVIEIIPFGNSASRTFPVRIEVENPKSILTAGMLVKVVYQPPQTPSKKIYVPKDALVRSPDEVAVWVVRPDPEQGMAAFKIMVTPGEEKNSMVAISPKKGRIRAGEKVVIQGNERLRPGVSVEIINEKSH